ncbi:MAG: hypothetical protein EBE86_028835 [Hormoscilla sp. GUM202]|nr:hypothetical protein [Hormoscilla sp. GUM202]
MTDLILITGDIAVYDTLFAPATVLSVQPGILVGTGTSQVSGKFVCVEGDEKTATLIGCAYKTEAFPTMGAGTLEILSLGGDQKAIKTKSNGKHVLLKGKIFSAKFTVTKKAQSADGLVIDPVPIYFGQGRFETANNTVKGT